MPFVAFSLQYIYGEPNKTQKESNESLVAEIQYVSMCLYTHFGVPRIHNMVGQASSAPLMHSVKCARFSAFIIRVVEVCTRIYKVTLQRVIAFTFFVFPSIAEMHSIVVVFNLDKGI